MARLIARIVSYSGVVWIEGDGWSTEPGWTGPFARWRARRYARRHGIELIA